MNKGTRLRGGRIGACSWYAFATKKFPISGWMVGDYALEFILILYAARWTSSLRNGMLNNCVFGTYRVPATITIRVHLDQSRVQLRPKPGVLAVNFGEESQ
jgi:hypothetical protein